MIERPAHADGSEFISVVEFQKGLSGLVVFPRELLLELSEKARRIPSGGESERMHVMQRAEMLFRTLAPASPHYVDQLHQIRFYPDFAPASDGYKARLWADGCNAISSLVRTLSEQLELFGEAQVATISPFELVLSRVYKRAM